jgi:thiamine-phosphate pyrophosphorylase
MTDDDFMPEDFATRFTPERRPRCQLYLISPTNIDGEFASTLDDVLAAGGVAAFQLRLKDRSDDEIAALAGPLQTVCAKHDVAFILNDNAALAKRIGADGVHLGQSDGSVAEARALLGKDAQIGVTCHDSRHLAMAAGEAGADYVAFGAFYASATKETTHRPDPAILTWWTTLFGTPCVAIGGITPDNAAPLVTAGADFLAVSSAVWGAADPCGVVKAFASVIQA